MAACTFLPPFFTAVCNQERLISYVLNKEILQKKLRGLLSRVVLNQERIIMARIQDLFFDFGNCSQFK